MRARILANSREKTRSLKESPGREPIVVTTSSGSPGNLNHVSWSVSSRARVAHSLAPPPCRSAGCWRWACISWYTPLGKLTAWQAAAMASCVRRPPVIRGRTILKRLPGGQGRRCCGTGLVDGRQTERGGWHVPGRSRGIGAGPRPAEERQQWIGL